MKRSHAITVALLLSLVTPGFAQAPQSATPPAQTPAAPPRQNEVVKIGVTLVQVDVTVTDKKGNRITDLRPEDFEVLQNKHPQHISNFSYVTSPPAATATEAAKPRDKKTAAELPEPPARLKPENIKRTIALVVDDLTLSFESTASVRQALKKYVEEQMRPGDLVAILRTAAGMGALQQFTNDKRLLYAAIERVRWSPSYGAFNTFAPVAMEPRPTVLQPNRVPNGADPFDFTGDRQPRRPGRRERRAIQRRRAPLPARSGDRIRLPDLQREAG